MDIAALTSIDWLLIAVAATSAVGWTILIHRRITTGQALLAPRRQSEPSWTLAEFFLCYGMWLVCLIAAITTAQRRFIDPEHLTEDGLPQTAEAVMTLSLAAVIAMAVVLVTMLIWMGLTEPRALRRAGFWPTRNDLRLGAIASFFILPPTYLLAYVLGRFVEYEHRVLDALRADPSTAVFMIVALSTGIVAPIFEEFLFRALLQGGAQKLVRRVQQFKAAIRTAEAEDEGESEPGESVQPAELQPEASKEVAADEISPQEVARQAWSPVIISSVVFALMHYGQGAAPVALFFFAIALGYIYRQTGRLWPCIVVHMALNLFSLSAAYVSTLTGTE